MQKHAQLQGISPEDADLVGCNPDIRIGEQELDEDHKVSKKDYLTSEPLDDSSSSIDQILEDE